MLNSCLFRLNAKYNNNVLLKQSNKKGETAINLKVPYYAKFITVKSILCFFYILDICKYMT